MITPPANTSTPVTAPATPDPQPGSSPDPALAHLSEPAQPDGDFSGISGIIKWILGGLLSLITGNGWNPDKGMDIFKSMFGGGGDGGAPTPTPSASQLAAINNPPPIDPTRTSAGRAAQTTTVGDIRRQEVVDTTLIALSDPAKIGQLDQSGLSGVTYNNGLASFSDGGKTRYFQQIAAVDGVNGTSTGLKATAWVETNAQGAALKDKNGKSDVHLEFAGYTGNPDDGSDQSKALADVANGKLNPQALEAASFTDRVIKQMGGKDHISNIIYGAHSLGASNALAAHVVSDLEGVHSKTQLLIEAAGATLAYARINEAMKQPGSELSRHLQSLTGASAAKIQSEVAVLNRDINTDTVSIREVVNGSGGLQGTLVSTLDPGSGIAAMTQAAHSEGIARALMGAGTFNPLGTGGNGLLGQIILEDVTGHQSVVANATQYENYDKDHLVANIRDAALHNDPMLNSSRNTLLSSGVVLTSADGVNAPIASKSPSTPGRA